MQQVGTNVLLEGRFVPISGQAVQNGAPNRSELLPNGLLLRDVQHETISTLKPCEPEPRPNATSLKEHPRQKAAKLRTAEPQGAQARAPCFFSDLGRRLGRVFWQLPSCSPWCVGDNDEDKWPEASLLLTRRLGTSITSPIEDAISQLNASTFCHCNVFLDQQTVSLLIFNMR